MTIQTLKDVAINGVIVKAGGVLTVPDNVGAALIRDGAARPRIQPGPTEHKDERLLPGDPLPPAVPFIRVPSPPQPNASFEPGLYQDQDNFVRDLVTLTPANPFGSWPWDDGDEIDATPAPPVTNTPSAAGRTPLLDLPTIKLHVHIEPDQTEEDELLQQYEMSARLHAENILRYQLDGATAGENTKQACLMLIAHWYRNRESVTTGRGYIGTEMPQSFKDLLSLERDYPCY